MPIPSIDLRAVTRRRFLAGATVATTALTSGLLIRSSRALAQQQTLKLAFPDTAAHPCMRVALEFAANLAKRTNGRFKVDIFPGGTLGSSTNIVAGLQTGIVDFAVHTAGYVSAYVPRVSCLDLPFLFRDRTAAQRVLAGDLGKQLVNDALAKMIVVLGWGQNGWRNVESVERVIASPKDFNGMKIRIQPGPIFAATFKAVGAVPVVMDASSIYVALQQKAIEALEMPLPSCIAFKTYEVTRHIALTRHAYNAMLLMASKPKFDAMSPRDQQTVRETGAEAAAHWFEVMGAADDDALKFCQENGSKVSQVSHSEFRAAMGPVYADAKARYGEIVDKLVKLAG